uniref:Cadherin domain-containing protein n=1 Tax=Panagrolaimus sp. PS1159 TaxID=55785 RepID=A0AC35FSH3_9BILA
MEGNYDSAFTIDDENYLRTAEELDAEIQTLYTLKVMATGKFVKSAETIIEIRVLDVNDNAPLFPPIKDQQISESLPIGSHITTVMANDVDADIDLEYMINPPNDYFYIGRFSGAIYLKEPLDYEIAKTIIVGIHVFDGVHIVKTNFTVNVLDVNDNPPKFTSDLYKFKVSTSTAKNDIIGKISAADPDEGPNGEFRFELLNESENLRIDSKSGELRLKAPLKEGMVYFAPIKAVDRGNPKLSSFAMIQIQFVKNIIQQIAKFKKEKYSFLVAENYPLYLPFGEIELQNQSFTDFENINFQILDKLYSDVFQFNNNGQLLLLQKLDYETVKEYRFQIGLIIDENGVTNTSKPKNTATIIIKVSDINDNPPTFNSDSTKIIKIDEQMKKGAILGRLTATDLDTADNSRIHFSILDGNQRGIIRIDSTSGAIIYDHWDDEGLYENPGINTFNITFMAIDNGSPPLWSVHSAQLFLNIDTWSGSAPIFAVPIYHKYICENSAIGSVVLKAQAHNKWDYLGNNWRYSISDNDEIFTIESHTGEIFLKGEIDYEKRNNYEFMVTVKDARHRSAVVPVEITVIGVDEFAPVFSKSSYTFEIPINAEVGQRIGNVFATDDDIGSDGKVYYSIPDDQYISFIGIDPDSGVLILREPFPINKTVEQITVIASSGLTQHSRATVYLEIASTNSIKATNIFGMNALNKYIIIVGALFFILLTLLCCIVFCIYFKSKNRKKKPQKQIYSVAKGNVAVMADINRMSPSYGKLVPSMSYERTKTFSLISSNSSDRNSNLFKSTHTDGFGIRSQPDSGIDPDALSISSSVTDYLLQIGVTPTKLDPTQLHQLSILGKPISLNDRLDPELSELIYAKVDDILAPGHRINVNNNNNNINTYDIPLLSASSLIPFSVEQENTRRAPTFQPLTEVFSQISRMKNEQQQNSTTQS